MFRTGSTSYVIPDHIIPNVEFLGPLVDDVQLVLFETDEYGSNLPSSDDVRRLNELAIRHDLTYTVHLPLDLRLGDDGDEGHISLVKARRVIEATSDLKPYAYTLHLDGRLFMANGGLPPAAQVKEWQDASAHALRVVGGWLDEPERLSIENIEAWDPALFAPLMQTLPMGRTIDVGHFWLQNVDPLDHMRSWIDRALVIHLHGVDERDHASLTHVPTADLDRVTSFLLEEFSGVVTLEVFSLADLTSSLETLAASVERVKGGSL